MRKKNTRTNRVQYGRNKKRASTQKMYVFVIGFIVLISSVAWVSHRPELTLEDIEVVGLVRTDSREVLTLARELLQGSHFYIIPKKFAFAYPRKAMEEAVLNTFKDVKGIDITREGFKKLKITIRERAVYAKWCGKKISEYSNCYLLDNEGYVFKKLDTESMGLTLYSFYGRPLDTMEVLGTSTPDEDDVASTTPLKDEGAVGWQYMNKEMFNRLNIFIGTLREEGIRSYGLYYPGKNEATILLEPSGELRIDIRRDLPIYVYDVIDSYKAKFHEEGARGVDELEYMDARFINKAIFKFSQEKV